MGIRENDFTLLASRGNDFAIEDSGGTGAISSDTVTFLRGMCKYCKPCCCGEKTKECFRYARSIPIQSICGVEPEILKLCVQD